MVTNYQLKIITAALFATSAVLPRVAGAAELCKSELGGYCVNLAATALTQSTPGLEFLGPAPATVGELLVRIYVFGLGLVVLAAFVGLVFAGGAYLLARDNEKWTSMARTWAGNAIFGLVLALLSYLILVTINPQLIKELNLNLRPITNTGSSGGPASPGGPAAQSSAPTPGSSAKKLLGELCSPSANECTPPLTCKGAAGKTRCTQ